MTEPARVVLGRRAIAHHGAHSGYVQVAERLPARLPVRQIEDDPPRRVPEKLAARMIERTRKPWYDAGSLGVDLRVARALWRGELCHLLYGEDTLHYSGLARRLGAPGRLVVTFHQPPAIFDEVIGDRRPLAGVDAAIAMSDELCDHLAARIRCTHHLKLGVDSSFFKPDGLPRSGCLFVGWWQRDLEVLAGVVRRVREELPGTDFDAVVPDWACADVRAATGIEPVSDIPAEELVRRYQRAAVVVLPLKAATANSALLEAAGCGAAIVATDIGGVRDHLGESCAELVPPGDAEAMALRVLELLANPARRAGLGARARERALELDWERVAEDHLELYRHVA